MNGTRPVESIRADLAAFGTRTLYHHNAQMDHDLRAWEAERLISDIEPLLDQIVGLRTSIAAELVSDGSVPDPADGRCLAMLQCHRETGHAGGHEAREAGE
jgi:hypothetical protein